MPLGMVNATNVTMHNITDVVNLTSGNPVEFFIRANQTLYSGWFFFIMMILASIILYRKAQDKQDQPLVNAMYICAAMTVVSFAFRAVYIAIDGIPYGLITSSQMWIFPLVAVGLATIVKFTSQN